MSEPGDVILAATLPELSFTATAIPDAKATLLANLPPLTFVASTGTLAGAALAATLPALVFAAQAVPVTDVALAGAFPPLELVAEGRYQSYAVRPVTGQSSTRWRHAASHDAGAEDRREATVREHAPTRAPWQAAGPRVAGVEYRRHSTRVRAPVANRAWHQEAVPVQIGAGAGHADAIRLRTARSSAFEESVRAEWPRWAVGHQDGWRDRRFMGTSRYEEARRHTGHFHTEEIQNAAYLRRWWRAFFQAAMRPLPGRHPPVPFVPPVTPVCYTPNAHLLFIGDAAIDGDLLFVCEHDNPNDGSVLVPNRRVYFVINEVTLAHWPDGTPVPVLGLSLSLDADSWAWGFEATLPVIAESLVVPAGGASPVELIATVNGTAFHVLAENLSRERTFGDASIRISGRGRSAALAAPYAPVIAFANTQPRSARQLMDDVLTFNGIPLGWDVDWALTDWLVPTGVFAKQGTWIEALTTIVDAAGGYLLPHPSEKMLRVRHRYPVVPWDWWDDVTPDYVLPVDVVARESLRWIDKPAYNRVFVAGQSTGVLGQVTRAGTAGDALAPMVVDALITEAAAARQRGIAELSDTGRQIEVTLRLPVLPETGIIEPGAFVAYQDGGVARLGIVRSTRVEAGLPEVWQTLGVESHA
ncbi:MAG: hypothetical protein AB1434_01385 [Pseudomonadota bacterium]|uniref:hypothetical protein n=1 Tax=Xenophilus sp. TaxID=1873499 RepID=UPI00346AECA0